MAKKKSKAGKKVPVKDNAGAAALSHNPFGSLSSLEGQVVAGSPSAGPSSVEAPVPVVPPEPVLRFPKKLVVRMEKKGRRGKTVTRISGLARNELKELAVEMKKALGCGAMVEDLDVILQGSLVDRAVAWLDKQGAKQIVKGT